MQYVEIIKKRICVRYIKACLHVSCVLISKTVYSEIKSNLPETLDFTMPTIDLESKQKSTSLFGKSVIPNKKEQLNIVYMVEDLHPLHLNLTQSIALALKNNTSIRTFYMNRALQRYQFHIEKRNHRWWYVTENAPMISINSAQNREYEQEYIRQSYVKRRSISKNMNADARLAFTSPIGTNISIGGNTSYNEKHSYAANISITQPLLKGFGYKINSSKWKQSQLSEQANVLDLRQQVSSTILQVIQQYRQVILAQLTWKNNKQALEEAAKTLENHQAEVNAGTLPKTELLAGKIQIESTKNSLIASEDDIKQQQKAFATLLGLDQHIKFSLNDDITIPAIELNEKSIIRYALENKPDYLKQQISNKMNQLNLERVKNEQLWDLSLTASSGRSMTPSMREKNNTLSAGLSLTIPLDNTNQKKEKFDAIVSIENDKVELNQRKIDIVSEVHRQLSSLDQSFKQLQIQEKQLLLQKQQIKNTELSFKYGRTTAYELAMQQQQINESRNSLVSNKISYLNQLSSLDDYLGTALSTWQIVLNP